MQTVIVAFNGQPLAFDLDRETRKWMPIEATTTALLQEGAFP